MSCEHCFWLSEVIAHLYVRNSSAQKLPGNSMTPDAKENDKHVKELLKALFDAELYGTSFAQVSCRKWWNPLRYFLGELKVERIAFSRTLK